MQTHVDPSSEVGAPRMLRASATKERWGIGHVQQTAVMLYTAATVLVG